jgi:hypothetical protein
MNLVGPDLVVITLIIAVLCTPGALALLILFFVLRRRRRRPDLLPAQFRDTVQSNRSSDAQSHGTSTI